LSLLYKHTIFKSSYICKKNKIILYLIWNFLKIYNFNTLVSIFVYIITGTIQNQNKNNVWSQNLLTKKNKNDGIKKNKKSEWKRVRNRPLKPLETKPKMVIKFQLEHVDGDELMMILHNVASNGIRANGLQRHHNTVL
jgi:hypothetical protein